MLCFDLDESPRPSVTLVQNENYPPSCMQPASWPCIKFEVIAEKFAAEQEAAEKGATDEVYNCR